MFLQHAGEPQNWACCLHGMHTSHSTHSRSAVPPLTEASVLDYLRELDPTSGWTQLQAILHSSCSVFLSFNATPSGCSSANFRLVLQAPSPSHTLWLIAAELGMQNSAVMLSQKLSAAMQQSIMHGLQRDDCIVILMQLAWPCMPLYKAASFITCRMTTWHVARLRANACRHVQLMQGSARSHVVSMCHGRAYQIQPMQGRKLQASLTKYSGKAHTHAWYTCISKIEGCLCIS